MRRNRRASRAERNAIAVLFAARVAGRLEDFPGIRPAGGYESTYCTRYMFDLLTPIGVLHIAAGDWIATCFDEPKLAKAWTARNSCEDSNPFSGKWNWHYDIEDMRDPQCTDRFFAELQMLMQHKPEQEHGQSIETAAALRHV